MPIPTPSKGEDKNAFISRCMSSEVMQKEFPDQKQRSAVCYSKWREHEGVEPMVYENIKFKFSSPFVTEEITKDEGKVKETKVKGVALPPTTSRNGRTYTFEEIHAAKITGGTISLNHTEDVTDNVGTVKFHKTDNGLEYDGVIYDTGKHPYVTDMLKKGLIRHVSIEAIAQTLEEDADGNAIVKGIDITGLGLVKTPGIPEASIALSEALEERKLSYKARKELPDSAFVFPNERKYPIHDIAHARNALARVAQHGTPEEQEKVKAAVYKKYPQLRPDNEKESLEKGDDMTEEKKLQEEEKPEEQPEEKEEAPEESEEKPEEKNDSEESLKAIKKELESVRAELSAIKEQPVSKGKVTEDSPNVIPLKKVKNKMGGVDLYCEEKFLY